MGTYELMNDVRAKSKCSIKPSFIIDNKRLIDRHIIANNFNKYFVFVFIATKINDQASLEIENSTKPISQLLQFDTFLMESFNNSIDFEDCTANEI